MQYRAPGTQEAISDSDCDIQSAPFIRGSPSSPKMEKKILTAEQLAIMFIKNN